MKVPLIPFDMYEKFGDVLSLDNIRYNRDDDDEIDENNSS